jgi:flagellar biogenesis protein FliO
VYALTLLALVAAAAGPGLAQEEEATGADPEPAPEAQPAEPEDEAARQAESERLDREREFGIDYDGGGTALTDPDSPPGPSIWSSLLRAILPLALVIGLIYAIYGAMRWLRRGAVPGAGSSGMVTVLESTRLGPDKSLHVVAVGSRVLLLSSSGAGVSFIAEIEDEELQAVARAQASAGFAEHLARASEDYGEPRPDAESPPASRAGDAMKRALNVLGSVARRGDRR